MVNLNGAKISLKEVCEGRWELRRFGVDPMEKLKMAKGLHCCVRSLG